MSDALPAGTVVAERYTVLTTLTVQAHEATYRATASWGGAVILTVFTAPFPGTPTGARIRQAFLRYARMLAQVQHPGILRVTDLIETPDQVIVVQDDRLHRPLRDMLGGRVLNAREAETLIRSLFSALGAAHAQALLHTQLTPEHIWFDADDQPVLAGFGLAHRALREAGPGALADPRYAAPELLSGGAPSTQTDLYALGAGLLEAASGQSPPPAGARAQGVPLPPLPEGTWPAVRNALSEALALEPAERAVSAAEILEGMDRAGTIVEVPAGSAASGEEETVSPPISSIQQGPPARVAPPAPPVMKKRARPTGAVAAVLVLLAVGGAVAGLRLTQGGSEPTAVMGATAPEPAMAAPEQDEAAVTPAATPEPEPVVLRTDIVTAANLNVRDQPNAGSTVMATVVRGSALDILEEQTPWLRVRTSSGQDGWVNGEHTLPLLGEEATATLLEALGAGGEVALERGVYWLTAPVRVTADVQLTGMGQKVSLLMSDAAADTLVFEEVEASLTGLSVIHVGRSPARAVLQDGGRLTTERVTLSGAVRDLDEEAYGSGLWVKGTGHATLLQTTLAGNAFGLYVTDSGHVQAEESSFSGNSEGGALFKDDATGAVSASAFSENGAHGVHVAGQATPEFTGNRIRRNRGRGVTIYDQARPTLTDNTVEENTLQGVGVQGEAQPRLNQNTIQGNRQSGLTFFDNSAGTAASNTVQANLKSGVSLTEYAAPTLSGNTIRRNRQNGLAYADHTGGSAENNVISGNGNPGISAWGDAQPRLTGNMVQGNKQSGVVLAERVSGQFSGNTVSDNALYGLIVTGNASPEVTENIVSGNTRGGIFYKQEAGGSGYGNICEGNGGPALSAELVPDHPGIQFSADGCPLE
ncbi:Putative kinase [Deinococcus deserti]|uniref:Putative kinase n=1 Tax=Deinococcus deserti (strain DSM 17065 / CIP 109153 / LMG 22923 / VCD115) TaxID=546414 RepID=C1D2V8_DEIDV|nr:right-handed parallel beta-helix repeat-containing protein [Deinococcus deserti]ACO47747.1 putative kinase [Deinococcus deserti VCD115]